MAGNSVMSMETQMFEVDPEQFLFKRLQEHGLLTISGLSVRVREGTAYISGCVPNVRQKKLATELARQTEGICEVVNMLRITPSVILDDLSLEKSIHKALSRNLRLTDCCVTVRVTNGQVYLSGFVGTAAEKNLAEREIWTVPGIKDIISDIQVLSEIPKSEVEIAEEIHQELCECLGLDVVAIKIDFQDGVVRMYGTVPTKYAKEAAEEIAMWTPQVRAVINELRVEYSENPDKERPAELLDDASPKESLPNLAVF